MAKKSRTNDNRSKPTVQRFFLTTQSIESIAFLLLAIGAAVLLFANLGDQHLWQDEAETALIAKTVLDRGLPYGHDGRNSFSQEEGREYGPDGLSRLHAWLPMYAVAGFYSVFGVNDFAARLPFALAGLASVMLCYILARQLWQSRRAAILSAILLGTSIPFLLLSRQCRYYSFSAFFALLGLLAYCGLLERKRWALPTFVLSAVLLFHSHYPYWPVLIGAAMVHAAVFRRDRLVVVIVCSLITLLLNLPWLIWLASGPSTVLHEKIPFNVLQPIQLIWGYVNQLFHFLFLTILVGLLFLLVAVGIVRKRRLPLPDQDTWRGTALLLLFVACNMLVFSIASPNNFFRYLAPSIPVLCVLGGRILDSSMRLHPALGVGGLVLIMYFSPIGEYCYEITHHYRGPMEGIVTYLNKHGDPDDVVAITYGDLPIKFYTPMRVVGGLTGEDLSPALKAKWVIIRRHTVCEKDQDVMRYLTKHLRSQDYRAIQLNYPDIPFNNRESPDEHLYRTVSNAPPVIIFKRITL